MESDEHICFKNLIAEIGNRLGYSVALEKRIRTEGTQKLIADVFLEKGNAKIVVEVQSSPQIRDDFKIRQDSYMKAGIRTAWLYRDKNDKIESSKEIPIFRYRK